MSMAFGITEDDIESVLHANVLRVANSNGKNFAAMASEIYGEFDEADFDRVAQAALDSGVEMDEQTEAAYAEIAVILMERGILESA